MRQQIDWQKIWAEFDVWLDKKQQPILCKCCDRRKFPDVDWEEQQCKIKRLINAQVREVIAKKLQDFSKQMTQLSV